MGSGPLAAQSLEFLSGHFDIELVITKAKPTWHKDPAPVEVLATQKRIPLAFANKSSELTKLVVKRQITSKLAIVVDYGVLLSDKVLAKFERGVINSHFSLLPEWRGADPITFALLSGQHFTGVSVMLVDHGLDTGQLLISKKVTISDQETNGSLTTKLVKTSNDLLLATINKWLNGTAKSHQQSDAPITYSTKVDKAAGKIDWNKPASFLAREVLAYSDWPQSWFVLGDLKIFIKQAKAVDRPLKIGQIKQIDNSLFAGCRLGTLELLKLKPAGKKTMAAKDFINGYGRYLG